ncbi:metal ABC transporter substrate-binding protein [Helicobacter trogontum]|uniref:metal ABC transporter substrate-binding protein n=1 Tax=Helicobacter trogontum TaxID=50960 RepID=UPI000CF19BE5|nr:zinc ABC transporter substrate-binding protein [Helicobacter trogontum]
MRKFLQIFVMLICCLYNSAHAEKRLQVNVSIPPLYFFVQEIAKSKADIVIIVPQNKNPETYEPTFKDMQALANSDIFIGIGMPFEKIWLPKILQANKQQHTLDTILLHEILEKTDQMHLWLSVKNAAEITNIITIALASKDPKNASFYRENAKELYRKLDILQQKIKAYVQQMPRKDFIIYHPLFDEASIEYGLKEYALEQHGKTYGMKEILFLADFGKKAGIKKVFAEHNNKDITTLAQTMQAEVVLINPMSVDYIANLESIFKEISKSYE